MAEVKEEIDNNNVEMQIIQVLDKIRPFIQRDGGDVRLVKFNDGIAYLRFYGACIGCSVIDVTLYSGIESILKDEIPEVVKVVNIDDDPNYDPLSEDIEIN